MRKLFFLFLLALFFAGSALAEELTEPGVKKRRPLPYEYGRITLNNRSQKAGLSPVVFEHWLHRARFTCRLCHVDLAFAMKAGGSSIRARDNMKGYYCGACHNGKMLYEKKTVFAACSQKPGPEEGKRCERCHSSGKDVKQDYDFDQFTGALPRERFGNGINWEKAEAEGLIKPVDFLEGVSITRPALAVPKEMSLVSKKKGMPDILFSHKKHAIWNGCVLCHPEIFTNVKERDAKSAYSMIEIFEGRYCGVCHGFVAFPLLDCQRCHTKPV